MTKLTSSQLIFFSKKVMSLFEKFSIDNSILLMMSGGHMNFPFIVSGNIKLSPNVREDISIMLIIGAIRVCSPISFKYISFWCLFSKPLAPPHHHILSTQYTPLKHTSVQLREVIELGMYTIVVSTRMVVCKDLCMNHPKCDGRDYVTIGNDTIMPSTRGFA